MAGVPVRSSTRSAHGKVMESNLQFRLVWMVEISPRSVRGFLTLNRCVVVRV